MRFNKFVMTIALAAAPAVARAHGPDSHQALGSQGGVVSEAGGHHVEFLAKDGQITLAITDGAGALDPTKGAAGTVTVLTGGKLLKLELTPLEPNLMTAKLDGPLQTGDKVVMSAKLADGHSLQARFVAK